MDERKFSDKNLHAWVDGELEQESDLIAREVSQCAESQAEVASVRRTGEYLREIVSEVETVEPLVALQNIRQRIEEAEAADNARLSQRIVRFWQDLKGPSRRALSGLAFAAALGAMVAPGATWFFGSEGASRDGAVLVDANTVVVESVEIEGSAKTVLFQPQGSNTAVIWIDTDEDVYEEKF